MMSLCPGASQVRGHLLATHFIWNLHGRWELKDDRNGSKTLGDKRHRKHTFLHLSKSFSKVFPGVGAQVRFWGHSAA
jgi:hypothetical protein